MVGTPRFNSTVVSACVTLCTDKVAPKHTFYFKGCHAWCRVGGVARRLSAP